MRLLLTRPEPDASRTAAALRELGHDVTMAPMLRVEFVRDAHWDEGPFAAVLFTSANAARAMASHPRRAALTALPAYAVGDSSAAAAREAGFGDVTSAGGEGADLVRLAATRLAGVANPVLYLAGQERARDLAGDLASSGIAVTTVVVYRTVQAAAFAPSVRAALEAGAIDGVLHFSRRSVESYLGCARDLWAAALAPVHYCLSERSAEPLRGAGAGRVAVAKRPEEAGLLALVTPRP